MNKKTLYIIRGLPGSGKTTLAKTLVNHPDWTHAADDFFTNEDGHYHFDTKLLTMAHQNCLDATEADMKQGVSSIAVHNTFSQRWEAIKYFEMANKLGYQTVIIECQNNFGSIHGVPEHAINAMAERWETLGPIKTSATDEWFNDYEYSDSNDDYNDDQLDEDPETRDQFATGVVRDGKFIEDEHDEHDAQLDDEDCEYSDSNEELDLDSIDRDGERSIGHDEEYEKEDWNAPGKEESGYQGGVFHEAGIGKTGQSFEEWIDSPEIRKEGEHWGAMADEYAQELDEELDQLLTNDGMLEQPSGWCGGEDGSTSWEDHLQHLLNEHKDRTMSELRDREAQEENLVTIIRSINKRMMQIHKIQIGE